MDFKTGNCAGHGNTSVYFHNQFANFSRKFWPTEPADGQTTRDGSKNGSQKCLTCSKIAWKRELGPIEDNYLRTPQTIYISTSPPCSCPKRMLMKSNSGHIPIIYLVLKLLNGYIMCLSCVTLLEENRSRKRKLEILCRFCYQLQWTATKKGTKIDGMFCPNDG